MITTDPLYFRSRSAINLITNNMDHDQLVTPRGVRLKCYYAFVLVCCGSDTSYIVSVHIQCQASKYTLSLCRGHSWRVRLAKQGCWFLPGQLVSTLVFRGPRMSIVVLYWWCHSDSASVFLYFTISDQYLDYAHQFAVRCSMQSVTNFFFLIFSAISEIIMCLFSYRKYTFQENVLA